MMSYIQRWKMSKLVMANKPCLPHSSKGSATSVASMGTRAKTAEAAGPELKETAAEDVPELIVEDSRAKVLPELQESCSKASASTVAKWDTERINASS